MKTNEFLDKTLKDFFPQQGNWKSSCFSKSKELEKNRHLQKKNNKPPRLDYIYVLQKH